jgi:MFS family permease
VAVLDLPRATSRRSRTLPDRVAFGLLMSVVVFFIASSAAPTPLYAVYAREWGFSPITTTVVFGVYAVAVLVSLLTLGRLSDHVGRRPVLLVAVIAQALTMLLFATASGVPELLTARVLQGVATGAAAGAVGAAMLDLDRARGTLANAISPPLGTAVGAIGSSLLVQFLPAPTHLVFLALGIVFVAQALGLALMRETSSRVPGALASVRPEFSLPTAVRRPLLVAAPALVAAWAIPGFFASLGPVLTGTVLGSRSYVVGSLALFILAAAAAVAVYVFRSMSPRRLMLLGTTTIPVGVGMAVLSFGLASAAVLFTGTVVAGIGFGSAFQGAIRMVVPHAAEHQRAGVLSVLYVVSYLAMGLPAVVGGFLAVYAGGVVDAGREYGLAVVAIAVVALLGLVRPAVPPARSCPEAG